jgi:hypothetical protein
MRTGERLSGSKESVGRPSLNRKDSAGGARVEGVVGSELIGSRGGVGSGAETSAIAGKAMIGGNLSDEVKSRNWRGGARFSSGAD